ncbi:MAG: hypothetical protein WBZ42_08835 [Halobacteriota archaeon]
MPHIDNHKIDQKLEFIHNHLNLPKPPTRGSGAYTVQRDLKEQVLASNFSESSVQAIANDIARFLGVPAHWTIKVVVGVETSAFLMGSAQQIEDVNRVGLYSVSGTGGRTITLTKKFGFRFEQTLGILAHEMTHNYLHYWNIRESDEAENEILTDVAAAYLGLGAILISGYAQATHVTYQGPTRITHTTRIGYISTSNVGYAMKRSAKMRNPVASNQEKGKKSYTSRITGRFRSWQDGARKNQTSKQVNIIITRVEELLRSYEHIDRVLQQAPTTFAKKVSSEDGRKIVDIMNALALGNVKSKLVKALQEAEAMKKSGDAAEPKLVKLSQQVDELSKSVTQWSRLISKYTK